MLSYSLLSGPGSSKVQAFDDTSQIHHSYLNQENFLDIKSYQFHKLKEDEWLESPGGWNIIGNTPLDIFNSSKEKTPNLINPGDTVVFKQITLDKYNIYYGE
mgnify:CR=1 FL=1